MVDLQLELMHGAAWCLLVGRYSGVLHGSERRHPVLAAFCCFVEFCFSHCCMSAKMASALDGRSIAGRHLLCM